MRTLVPNINPPFPPHPHKEKLEPVDKLGQINRLITKNKRTGDDHSYTVWQVNCRQQQMLNTKWLMFILWIM